jgi:hypothetical protein
MGEEIPYQWIGRTEATSMLLDRASVSMVLAREVGFAILVVVEHTHALCLVRSLAVVEEAGQRGADCGTHEAIGVVVVHLLAMTRRLC